MMDSGARAFDIWEKLEHREESGELYLEFLNVPVMSAGVYELAAGSTDPQSPHTEDEIYYVLDGRGRIRVGKDDIEVKRGYVIFVPAGVEHRFHSLAEDLRLLVVFAPARGSSEKQ